MCGSLLLSSHYDNDNSSNMKSNCIRHEFSVIYYANYNCHNYDNDNIMYFGVTSSQILHTKNSSNSHDDNILFRIFLYRC